MLGAIPVSALAGKQVTIYPGVNLYVDDALIEPKDANGSPVEVFIYNGTTYLPVRAIGEAFGKTVAWEGSTSSVYVGKHASDKPAVYLKDLEYFYSNYSGRDFYFPSLPVEDNYGNAHGNCMRSDKYFKNEEQDLYVMRTYLLNGTYSRITGTTFISHSQRSATLFAGSGVEIYCDDELVYSNRITKSTEQYAPVDFDVDLTGVLKMEVRLYNATNTFWNNTKSEDYALLYLGDCGLWS